MSNFERLSKNVERWSAFCPNEAAQIIELQNSPVSIVEINGFKNLKKIHNGIDFFYHALENPEEESQESFRTLNLKDVDVLYVWGVGLGYFYLAAKEWLKASSEHSLIFLEDDLSVVRCLFETEIGTEIVRNPQVWLYALDPNEHILDLLSSLFVLKSYRVTALETYIKTRGEQLFVLKSKITFWSNFKYTGTYEYKDFGVGFLRNFYHNLLQLPRARLGNQLFSRFSGMPAIICGAGPSLEKNLHVLEKLKDRALIFAGGTSMNAVNAHGFVPHFGVGIDPNPDQFTRLITNISYETPYFYRNRWNYEGQRLIHGDHLYVTGTGGYEIGKWIENQMHIHGKDVAEGHNVINFSLSIAVEMGCNPIIFVGLDLAYSNNASYAPGVLNHPIHNRHHHFKTKDLEEELIVRKDIFGNDVNTLWKWVTESLWFAQFAASNPKMTLINATEGGIGFGGIPNMSLKEAAEQFLDREFDTLGLVHGELQRCVMPEKVTSTNVENALFDFREGLKKSAGFLWKIRNELEGVLRGHVDGKEPPPSLMSEEALKQLELLRQEPVYAALLETFEGAYQRMALRHSQRLTLDEEIIGGVEVMHERLRLLISQYQFVYDAARFNIGLINEVLDEAYINRQIIESRSKLEIQNPPHEKTTEGAIYTFDGKQLIMIDPELELDCNEIFEPQIPAEAYDPQGVLRMKNYYKEGKLHGPSEYYDSQGRVIARSWFYNGLREGKAWFYYPNGVLAGLQRFKNGLWQGRQESYYDDGRTKALIHYNQGQLHGDVLLYCPLGRIKREIHFVEGKREGIERIWNENGLLVIEANYYHGLPKGKARRWFDNGNIAQEIIYDDSGTAISEEKWTIDGFPLSKGDSHDDYFDRVTKETSVLTKTLGDVLEQVSTAAPLLMKHSGVKDDDQAVKDIKAELVNLEKEMENLRQISQQIFIESGLGGGQHEPIWKSQSVRHSMEEQINEMTQKLQGELSSIKDNLVKSLTKFTQDLPKHENNEKK